MDPASAGELRLPLPGAADAASHLHPAVSRTDASPAALNTDGVNELRCVVGLFLLSQCEPHFHLYSCTSEQSLRCNLTEMQNVCRH